MTTLGYIVISFVSIILVYFVYSLIKDLRLNYKLTQFHKNNHNVLSKTNKIFWLKRSYGSIITSLFLITLVFSNVFSAPIIYNNKTLVNAIPVNSAQTIKNLMSNNNKNSIWEFVTFGFRNFENLDNDMIAVPEAQGDQQSYRSIIGTNTQDKKVDEGDIVKTDGYQIFYATRYRNEVKVLDVNTDGTLNVLQSIDLGNLYTDQIYITETKLIVIGYIYTYQIYDDSKLDFYYSFYFQSYTGAVYVYDRDTYELDYKLETDSNFYDHRLVDNQLILISNKSLNDNELRPSFKTTKEGTNSTSHLGYNEIFYFRDVPIYSMTVITSLNLDDYTYNSQAFLGYIDQIYMSYNSLYTVYNYSFFDGIMKEKSQVLKFNIDKNNNRVNYQAQAILDGYVENQYWMDEYNLSNIDYLRVVVSPRYEIQNKLFVLKESDTTDELVIVGSITNNLGLEGERVKSVRFEDSDGYVVTFRETDPVYKIDLSEPTNPLIVSIEKAPGYSTSLYKWNHSDHLIGFGFNADSDGFISGMSLRAFKLSGSTEIKDEDDSVDVYHLGYFNDITGYSYSYSEALYNPKAIMVDQSKNIIAFPVMSYRLNYHTDYNYEYQFESKFLVFIINFDAENDDNIISDPIEISHGVEDFYSAIDRGIYIDFTDDGIDNGFIYTLSHSKVQSYNIITEEVLVYDFING